MNIKTLAEDLYSANPDKTLYHYTSLAALLGIIKSSSIWASDIRYLNDEAELKHTANLLHGEISKKIENGEGNSELLKQFKEWISHRITDGHMLFVASLTANGNLLSQWRGYCPLGKGVSIGFSPDTVSHCANKQKFLVGKCIYHNTRQIQIVKHIIEEVELLALSYIKNPSRHHPSQSYYGLFESVEVDLLQIAALLKHHSFEEEEEWRIVSPVLSNYVEPPIRYREGISMLIPYLEFDLIPDGYSNMIIQHVILGPTPNHNLSMSSLSRYLSKEGVSPKEGITACLIPFRQW